MVVLIQVTEAVGLTEVCMYMYNVHNKLYYTLIADTRMSYLEESSGNVDEKAFSSLILLAIPPFCGEPAGCLVLEELWKTT